MNKDLNAGKRHSSRAMSRPNRDKALKRIHRELLEMAYASPTMRGRGGKPLSSAALPFPVGYRWDEMVKAMKALWPEG